MNVARAVRACAVVVLANASLVAQDQRPTFRGGVELVTVDVVAFDKSGKVVGDLKPSEFSVTAGGRPRRIVNAEFISTRPAMRGHATTDAPAERIPGPSNNSAPVTGRTFMFAVDVDEIRAGGGQIALRNVGEYLDRLGPDDRVGLVSLPYNTPRVEITTDRDRIRKALGEIVGASTRLRESTMTPGEAAAILQRDAQAVVAYWERTVGLPAVGGMHCGAPTQRPFEEPSAVSEGCVADADRALTNYRRHTRIILDALEGLATAMTPLPGMKTLVLMSEGLLTDPDNANDVAHFAATTERARVSLYALHLDAPPGGDSSAGPGSNPVFTTTLDDREGFNGLAEAAYAARGTALRVIGKAIPALEQIDEELSGYYLISFERDLQDRDGQREKIDLRVTRPGLDVRARREFTPLPATTAPPSAAAKPVDLKTTIGELIQWPVAVGDVPIDLDAYTLPAETAGGDTRVLIATEIGAAAVAAVGYEIRDASGRAVADGFEKTPALQSIGRDRSLYTVTVALKPGRYEIKLGAVDNNGKRGSVQHDLEASAPEPGGLRAGEVVLGDASTGTLRPIAHVPPTLRRLTSFVELRLDAVERWPTVKVTLDVRRADDGAPLLHAPVSLTPTANPLRRVATTDIDLRDYKPGRYIVTFSVMNGGEPVVRRRVFEK